MTSSLGTSKWVLHSVAWRALREVVTTKRCVSALIYHSGRVPHGSLRSGSEVLPRLRFPRPGSHQIIRPRPGRQSLGYSSLIACSSDDTLRKCTGSFWDKIWWLRHCSGEATILRRFPVLIQRGMPIIALQCCDLHYSVVITIEICLVPQDSFMHVPTLAMLHRQSLRP